MSIPHLPRILPRTWRTGAERALGQPPAWMWRLGLALGLLVLGARASFASATFMAPGADIRGWSQLPSARCALGHVGLPPRAGSGRDQTAWQAPTGPGGLPR